MTDKYVASNYFLRPEAGYYQRMFVIDPLGSLEHHLYPKYEADKTDTSYFVSKRGTVKKGFFKTITVDLLNPLKYDPEKTIARFLKFVINDHIENNLRCVSFDEVLKKIVSSEKPAVCERLRVAGSKLVFPIDGIDEDIAVIFPDPELFGCLPFITDGNKMGGYGIFCWGGSGIEVFRIQ